MKNGWGILVSSNNDMLRVFATGKITQMRIISMKSKAIYQLSQNSSIIVAIHAIAFYIPVIQKIKIIFHMLPVLT